MAGVEGGAQKFPVRQSEVITLRREITDPCPSPLSYGQFLFSWQGAAVVGGHHTDVAVVDFGNRLMIVLTQYQKLGTLVSVVSKRCNGRCPSLSWVFFLHGCQHEVKKSLGKFSTSIHVTNNLVNRVMALRTIVRAAHSKIAFLCVCVCVCVCVCACSFLALTFIYMLLRTARSFHLL